MNTKDAIKKRRSIRSYNGKAVEFEKVTKIIEAGMYAPSSGELKDTVYIMLTDQHKISKLSERCKQQYWMAQAPVIILVCANEEKCEELYGLRGKRLYSIQNSAAAIQNMMLRATSLKLSTCWVGNFDENYVKDEFDIPDTHRPQGILTIGYSDEKQEEQKNFKMEGRVFFETFGNKIKDYAAFTNRYGKRVEEKVNKFDRKIQNKTNKAQSTLRERFKQLKERLTKNK